MSDGCKRCPFCGSGDLRIVTYYAGPLFYVYCHGCGARGAKMPSTREALAAWNRRCGEPRTARGIARATGITV